MGFPSSVFYWSISLILLAVGAATDVKDRIIPNELVAGVAAIGLAEGLTARSGTVWLSLLIAVVSLFGLGLLSRWELIGGGDTKLVSAVTLLVPPGRVGQLLAQIVLAGGVVSCFYLAAHYRLKGLPAAADHNRVAQGESGWARAIRMERDRIAAGNSLPYALAVLGGVGIFIAREFY